MISFFWNSFESTSITDVIHFYWNNLVLYITDTLTLLRISKSKSIAEVVDRFPDTIYFEDFQWKLLRIFSALLLLNLFFIFVVWRIYGRSICERFMKLSTQREIEELRASVSKLKLPKEHTPRI